MGDPVGIGEPDRVRIGHEPVDRAAFAVHHAVLGQRPVAVELERAVVRKAAEAQGVADQHLEHRVHAVAARTAAPELAMHEPVLVPVPATIAEAFPVERQPQDIAAHVVEIAAYRAVAAVQDQELVHVADQQPVGLRRRRVSAHRRMGAGLGRLTVARGMLEHPQPTCVLQDAQQIGGPVGAVVDADQHVEPKHPVPAHPFDQERTFVAHAGKDEEPFGSVGHRTDKSTVPRWRPDRAAATAPPWPPFPTTCAAPC